MLNIFALLTKVAKWVNTPDQEARLPQEHIQGHLPWCVRHAYNKGAPLFSKKGRACYKWRGPHGP